MNPTKIELPRIFNYVNYSSGNYGAHCMAVEIPQLITVYFSYKTIIAFRFKGNLVVRENEWGPTTGKHLNAIDEDKKSRISGKTFELIYELAVNNPGIEADVFRTKMREIIDEAQCVREALAA
jgi:hypothetical protein